MAKLEEILELLVSEIKDFEEAVKKLEEIQRKKIQLDISELQLSLNIHEKKLSTSVSDMEKQFNQMKERIGEAKIYPTWAVVILLMSLIINCVAAIIIFF